MSFTLDSLFQSAQNHRASHQCGGYPYEHAQVLSVLVRATGAKRILELGTGLGYSTIYLALGNNTAHVDTIDQSDLHLAYAKDNFEKAGVAGKITTHYGKAEAILKKLDEEYDLIFFDGHAPSMKFLVEFQRLLKRNGVLISANMFVKDPQGGRYMRALQKTRWWKTALFADTTIAVKL